VESQPVDLKGLQIPRGYLDKMEEQQAENPGSTEIAYKTGKFFAFFAVKHEI
jgi:hypothetical protein